jgi:hypothetical protein
MSRAFLVVIVGGLLLGAQTASAQSSSYPSSASPSSPGSSSAGSSSSLDKKHVKAVLSPDIDVGGVVNGVYRNRALGMTCKIPAGWVLRTEEMNAEDAGEIPTSAAKSAAEMGHPDSHPVAQNATRVGQPQGTSSPQGAQRDTGKAKVLLAAFSRPPAAAGEDVNASILIAAESVAAYPGMKEAVQYLEPLAEVAKAQGFAADGEPYEITIGRKVLAREDFRKDVGTRVMRQATMAMLAKGYAVSITVIGGTEDEVEDLVDGLEFGGGAKGK